MRDIKFRIIYKGKVNGYERLTETKDSIHWEWMALDMNPDDGRERWVRGCYPIGFIYQRDQFTGKTCHNNKEVYQGDILFYEESEENGDKRYYLVVTWIQEWCMFATLHIEEYLNYIREGKEALDEVLFWTYPIEESEDYHYAGTIHENPELLNQ